MVVGILLGILALGMVIPMVADATVGNPDWMVFAAAATASMFVAVAMILTCRAASRRMSMRQVLITTTLSWIILCFFAALPFVFSGLGLSLTDAFFEATSGATTTGSTVITGLDSAAPGVLLWRSLLQWMGGIGTIAMAVSIMPMLKIGGSQLFRIKSSEHSEGSLPKVARTIGSIVGIYVVLTIVLATAYWAAGMSGFEAYNHAMTTISTGGFSTSDDSLGHFASPDIEVIAILGMIVGSLPFILYLKSLRGDFRSLLTNSQVQWFLSIVAMVSIVVAGEMWLGRNMDPLAALRYASFNTISIITGTGYAAADHGSWSGFAFPVLFFMMFIGGCAGSTVGGIKVFRFQVLYAGAKTQIHSLIQPHGVFIPYYNRQPITEDVIVSVLGFFFLFGLSFTVLALGLAVLGLDFVSAISISASALANVGPALGPMADQADAFKSLPDAAKWLLSAGMLLGRLELFTVLVLFSRSFWRG